MIRQFDVFRNPIVAARGEQPYVVSIQHRDLDHLRTRLTAPLASERIIRAATRLHPEFRIEGRGVYLLPQNLLALPLPLLRRALANLEAERDRIVAAIDMTVIGV